MGQPAGFCLILPGDGSVTFEFGYERQVITRIAGASSLKDVDTDHLNRVITQTTKLTDLMPFKGGTIRVRGAALL